MMVGCVCVLYTCTLHLQLFEKGSCDRHVIVALTRAHLALGDVESAEKVFMYIVR